MTAVPQIHIKMAAILRDVEAIGKLARNQAQGFNYRGIDDVYNALNPVLAKHGVYMTAQIVDKSREERTNTKGTVLAFTMLRMRYRFYAEDGSYVETEAEGEGMDSGDKSSNKAMAIAHKYALLQAFCVPTKEMVDPDAEAHEVAPKSRHADARDVGQQQAPAKTESAVQAFLKGKVLTLPVPGAKAGKPDWSAYVASMAKAIAACEDFKTLDRLWGDNAKPLADLAVHNPNMQREIEHLADARRDDVTPPASIAAE